ncbi:hypothetical protein Q6301_26520, partial [Klebsiella quasipneumoniae]|uniref:hypothetical protein n=1 Tax=Klebsiella quasipneumoniae TaxID=1463165 RepID=UPI00272EEC24
MSSPIARRSAVARLLAVQIMVLVVFFIGTALLLVPTAAKAGSSGSSGNHNPVGTPTIHRTSISGTIDRA